MIYDVQDRDDAALFDKLKKVLECVKLCDDFNFTACCPCHEGKSPSVKLQLDDKLLVKCYAGCDKQAVFEKLRELGGDDELATRTVSRMARCCAMIQKMDFH